MSHLITWMVMTDEAVQEGGVPDLIWALFIISLISVFSANLRRHTTPESIRDNNSPPGTPKLLLLHFLSSLEYATFALELNYILWMHYPGFVYIGSIFLWSMYQARSSPFAPSPSSTPHHDLIMEFGNPVDTFRYWLIHEESLFRALLIMLAQVGGACSAYPLIIRPLWSTQKQFLWLGGHLHLDKINTPIWPSSVFEEDPRLSALAEAFVTCAMYLVTLALGEWGLNLQEKGTRIWGIVAINTLIYAAGAPYSGAFYNPATATGLELLLTTGDSSLWTKIWIYWLAPFFGITLASRIKLLIIPHQPQPSLGRQNQSQPRPLPQQSHQSQGQGQQSHRRSD